METIDNKIKNMGNDDIIIKKSNPIAYLILSIIGVALCIIGFAMSAQLGSYNTLCIVAGLIILLVGIILWVSNANQEEYIYRPNGQKLKKYKIYLNHSNMDKLVHCLENQSYDSLKKIEKEMNANKMLVAMITNDGSFALAQTFEYIPYVYEPTGEVHIIKEHGAKSILEFCR